MINACKEDDFVLVFSYFILIDLIEHSIPSPASLPHLHNALTALCSANITPLWQNIYHFPSSLMCQWFVTEFLDINSEILAQMTGGSEASSNHVFNHFLTPLLSKWSVGVFVQTCQELKLNILVWTQSQVPHHHAPPG